MSGRSIAMSIPDVKGWFRAALGSFRNFTLFGGSGFDRFKAQTGFSLSAGLAGERGSDL